MFLLIPGGQSAALGCLVGSLINFFVWPALFSNIPNYGNAPGFFGITSNQWGIIGLLLAF